MKRICYVATLSMTIDAFFIPQLQFIAAHGIEVTVVCSPDSGLQDRLGKKIKYVPIEIPRGVSVGGTLRAISELTDFFKKEKFDLIQYSTPNAAFCASVAAKRVGCPIRNYHLMGFRYLGAAGVGRAALRFLEKTSCRLSTHIECVSRSNREFGIAERLFPAEKAVVVWNGSSGGVDLKRFNCSMRPVWRKQVRQELGLGETDFVFGFAGRITRDKGINELLTAFFTLEGDAKLLLIGAIEDEGTLDRTLRQKAVYSDTVIFHDFVKDIERYYAAMDVLVLPSYREGFGMVIAEAAAMGTPAIVSNIPGPIDVIEAGKTALTVEVKNSADLVDKMRTMMKMDCSSIGVQAAGYTKEYFDSEVLCEKVFYRKATLLGIKVNNDEDCSELIKQETYTEFA